MEWLVILALGAWIYRQGQQIRKLERRLDAADAAPRVALEPVPPPAETSAIAERMAAPPPALEPKAVPEPVQPRVPTPELAQAPRVAAASLPPPRINRESVSTWLSENGLAWIGGGGLALGGLLLVAYAAQRGLFIPEFRIALAVILGAAMLGASEWILRQAPSVVGGRHLLAAAVSAGAGAVTLYGAICAAHGLYHLIPLGLAAVLAAGVSLGLLGLSLRHGEPLALVAMVGAVLTPAFTGLPDWSPLALTAYAGLIGATGFSISALRLWGKAGGATIVGLLLLSGVPLAQHQILPAAIIQILAAAGPFAATLWRRRFRPDDTGDPAGSDFQGLPALALVLATLASVGPWFSAPVAAGQMPIAILVSGFLIVLAAALALRDMIRPGLFALPVGMAILCQLLAMVIAVRAPAFAAQLPWLYAQTALIPAIALWLALGLPAIERTRVLAIGGIGVAILASLTWPILHAAKIDLGWAPAAVLAAALFGAAVLIARRVEQASTDRGLALWLAAAAEMAFLAVHAAVAPRFEPAAFGLAALALAVAAWRLPWRGLAPASVVGGLIAFIAMMRPDFIGAALDGRLPPETLLAVSAVEAGLLATSSALIWKGGGESVRNEVEAQRATGLLIVLLALFAALHVVMAGPRDQGGDGLLEASLRTLMLLSTGLLLVLRQRPDDGPITRWRTVIVVSLGVAHGVLLQGLVWNPWWGMGEAPAGPPVLNTLLLSYLAPAGLLAAIAWRRRPAEDRWTKTWVLAIPLFALLWAVLALRHLFHGAVMSPAPIGRAEGAAYALLALLAARQLSAPSLAGRAGAAWLARVGPVFGWLALIVAGLVFGVRASPWWGPMSQPLAPFSAALLLFGLYGLGAGAMLGLRRADRPFDRTALAMAVGTLFVLLTLLIRYVFHGGDMHAATGNAGLETWTFSALWAVFGLAVLGLGAARKDIVLRWAGLAALLFTAAKVVGFDLARLEGVTRAASFLAVGALFIGGALLARRLNARRRSAEDLEV
ncbi:DUF2339 domain-containing protein [Caulobacter sp. FWC2]|uniref:DUF2339 domain-containing protein n=1 Tax=Caulobacter sp. FWC2 TaxID=69664 RepID=UPI000C1581AD|nr:DUF2339 domain-containing protein [Caulobacter sp. FWC2]PIB94298.1 hypothetical protein CSW62_23635 [Caulobacter sp. FWC2]